MSDWKPVELFKMGVMRLYFLLRAISRVAEFCKFWKRSLKNLGEPYNKELQLIQAWTKASVSDIDKQSLISAKLRKWKKNPAAIVVRLHLDCSQSSIFP